MAEPITLGGVTLPGDLRWSDEFAWSPVARAADYSLTGALIVEEAAKLAGRPITLEAKSEELGYVWLERSAVEALAALAATPGWTGILTLADARQFTVAFRDEGVTADPVRHRTPAASADPYTLVVRLHTV